MRFMIIVKATKDSEAGVLPTEEQLAEMGKCNEELARRTPVAGLTALQNVGHNSCDE